MKKTLFIFALSTLFVASCQKELESVLNEEEVVNNKEVFTFKASIENLGDTTKGTINASHQFVWAEGDNIGIYFPDWGDKNQPFTLKEGDAGKTNAEFVRANGDFVEATATAAYYPWEPDPDKGVYTYPSISQNNVYEGIVYFKLKNEYWSYTSGKMLTPLIASITKSSDDISFKHAGAAIKLTINNLVSGTYATKMTVHNKQITGDFHVNPANAGTEALALDAAEDTSKDHITLHSWKSDGAFSWVFPVPELAKPKLSFEIKDDNGIVVMSKNLKAQTTDLSRGEILVMPPLDITPYSKFSKSAEWTFCGKINGTEWVDDIPMYTDGTVCILKGITFKKDDNFRIRKDKSWDVAYPEGIENNWVITDAFVGTKDIIFNISTHAISVVDSKYPYPSEKVTLYFGINTEGGTGIALRSDVLAKGYSWPGLTLTEKEQINGKWYYKHTVDAGIVWRNSISEVYIVGIGNWNTSSSTLDFTTLPIANAYYIEATSSTALSAPTNVRPGTE